MGLSMSSLSRLSYRISVSSSDLIAALDYGSMWTMARQHDSLLLFLVQAVPD